MNKLVNRYLFYRKKRTIASIIGIALAIILAVGIGGIIESFIALELDTVKSYGDWHYKLSSPDEADDSRSIFETVSSKYDKTLGEALAIGFVKDLNDLPTKDDDPIYIKNILDSSNGKNFESMIMKYKKIEGRLPQNSDEIILSDECKSLVGEKSEVTLSIYNQSKASEYLYAYENKPETLTGISKTFKVVGFYDGFSSLGYTYNLDFSTINARYETFIQIKESEKSFETVLEKILSDCNLVKDESVAIEENYYLLQMLGKNKVGRDQNNILKSLFVGIVIFILVLMGIVIKNSVSMSAFDKIEQFGMLRCLGATKIQIVKMVVKEAIIMWGLSLVFGYVVSFVSIEIVLMFIRKLLEVNVKFILPVWECVVSAVLSFFTIIVCSYLPGRKASKVSPVGAVRGVTIVKAEKIKKTRKGKLLNKLFGFSGFLAAKNIRRNKKRFRSTLFSITTATILFILFSTVVIQIDTSLRQSFRVGGAEFIFDGTSKSKSEDILSLNDSLKETEGVDKICTFDRSNSNYWTGYDLNGDDTNIAYVSLSEKDYDSLDFIGEKPSYKDLIDQKAGVILQTVIQKKDGRYEEIRADYKKVNDAINCFTGKNPNYDPENTNDNYYKTTAVKILGEVKTIPWFLLNDTFTNLKFYLIVPSGTLEDDVCKGRVCVKSKKNYESKLSKYFNKEMKSNNKFYFANIYERRSLVLNLMKVFDLFMIIFVGIIVLICFVNLINTITSNLQSRKCEIATLQSMGMSKKQLLKMLRLECVLYGFIATAIGAPIAIFFEVLFYNSRLEELLVVNIDVMLNVCVCLISLAFTVLICLWSGYGPIKRLMKTSIIDGIRSNE